MIDALISLMPTVKRARGYRLYDHRGLRYLDMYQNGGHAILGHRAGSICRAMKNVISTGCVFDLPSSAERKAHRALSSLFPEFEVFRIFASVGGALNAVSQYVKRNIAWHELPEPWDVSVGDRVVRWRPFVSFSPGPEADILIPVLPFSVGGAPVAVCFRNVSADRVPSSEIVSPVLLEGAARAIHDLVGAEPSSDEPIVRYDAGTWKLVGSYLIPQTSRETYEERFRLFLEERVLLSPSYPAPSIIPRVMSVGERLRMEKLLQGK